MVKQQSRCVVVRTQLRYRILVAFLIIVTLCLTGCETTGSTEIQSDNPPISTAVAQAPPTEGEAAPRDATPKVLETVASGVNVINGNASSIDISNVAEGYIMLKYTGGAAKVKVQIMKDGADPYNYDFLPGGDYEALPLSQGSGNYVVTVNENIEGNSYAVVDTASFDAAIADEFAPFLRPSKYVNYNASSAAVALSQQLAEGATSDLQVIESIYNYVAGNISYDYDFAAQVSTFYVPNVDETFQKGTGLCFDYAVSMTALLRLQGIPAQLILGYSTDVYHAWLNVYTEETGWVQKMIYFDGTHWIRMDPTFASTGGGQFVGDGDTYNPMYYY